MKTATAILLLTLSTPLLASTEGSIHLKDAPGKEKVLANCVMCHSLDYIPMNSFLDKKGWEAEVNKMINAMGAPIKPDDAREIIGYLDKMYSGREMRP